MRVERRRYERYDLLAQIRVKRGRINYIMDVVNLSIVGAFVSTESMNKLPWFRIGQEVEMDLFASEDLDNIRIMGKIVRIVASGDIENQGFGVEFTEMTDESSKKIQFILNNKDTAPLTPPPLPN